MRRLRKAWPSQSRQCRHVCFCGCVWVTGASDDKRWQIGVKAPRRSPAMPTMENPRHQRAWKKEPVENTQTNTQTGRHRAHLHTKMSGWQGVRWARRWSGTVAEGHFINDFIWADLVFVFRISKVITPIILDHSSNKKKKPRFGNPDYDDLRNSNWDYRSTGPTTHPFSFAFKHQRWTYHHNGCVTVQCSSSFMVGAPALTGIFYDVPSRNSDIW